MKIFAKLSLFSVAMVLLLLTVGAVGYYGLSRSNESLRTMYEDRVLAADQLGSVAGLLLSNRTLLADAMQAGKSPGIQASQPAIEANLSAIRTTWQAYDATYMEADERAMADDFARLHAHYMAKAFVPVQKALLAGQFEQARELYQAAVASEMPVLWNRLQRLTQLQTEVSSRLYKEAQQRMEVMVPLYAACIAVGILIAATFSYALARNLLGQLGAEPGQVLAVVKAVSSGNLTTPIAFAESHSQSVMAGLQEMQQSLRDIVGSVREGSENVASSSSQIAAGNHDLSARTEQQAAALQQTAAAMTQLGTAVQHNAGTAKEAAQLAQDASHVAARGGAVVAQVVQKMRGIQDASQKIAEITAVIDSIAFQTNILALNAAVEAARAGEEGRGFAVVAGEVRSLAGRSAHAAKEIKALIQGSVEQVEQGNALVDQAGNTMRDVVTSIAGVADLIGTISAASEEGARGVSQVGEAVVQMDSGVQQNAALVEEMAAAALALKTLAGNLVDKVAVFKLDHLAPGVSRSPLFGAAPRARTPLTALLRPQGQERRAPANSLFAV